MPHEYAIEADGLHKRYGQTTVLDGLDLRIPRASVLALLGPNGAGKTTAVRLLSTLNPPTEAAPRSRAMMSSPTLSACAGRSA